MNCKEFREKVADLFDKTIDMHTQAQLQEHMNHCPECKTYYEELCQTFSILQPRVSAQPVRHPARHQFWRIAAIFFSAVFLAGLSFAAGLSYATHRAKAPKQETEDMRFANEKMLELTDGGKRIIITWLKGTWVENDFGSYIEADSIEHSPALSLYGEHKATIQLNGETVDTDNLPDLPASSVNKLEIRFAAGRIVNLITTPAEIPYTDNPYGE